MTRTQATTWIVLVVVSWYGMMAVHEAGHCIGALVTGAAVHAVELPLVGFSRTEFSGGSSPLLVVWAGPVLGAILPLLLLALVGRAGRRAKHALLFFVGFCLLANGAYIGLGAFSGAGDCRQMLQYGSPMALLLAFGIASSAAGLCAWHRMGPFRGWFARADRIGNRAE